MFGRISYRSFVKYAGSNMTTAARRPTGPSATESATIRAARLPSWEPCGEITAAATSARWSVRKSSVGNMLGYTSNPMRPTQDVHRTYCSAGNPDTVTFQNITYAVSGKVAHINFNRPHVNNAIDANTPVELEHAVALANADTNVKVIVLSGEPVFCSGYDLKKYAEGERGDMPGSQKMPWDPYVDYQFMWRCTEAWMSLWRSMKPTIAKIKGVAIGGGSDIALCCDLTVIAEDAKFGYPPTRVWGCPTTAMWVYRVGMEKAKRLLLGGEVVTGRQAVDMGLLGQAVPLDQLDSEVDKLTARLVTVPSNQLWFQKQVINNAIEQMGLLSTQRMATLFDGMSRHTPEGVAFQQRAKQVGFKQAVKERDTGVDAAWSDGDKSKL